MLIGGLLFLIVYGFLNYYVGIRFLVWLQLFLPTLNSFLFWGGYLCLALSFFPTTVWSFSAFTKFWSVVANYWLGIFFYLLLGFLVSDLFSLAGQAWGWLGEDLTQFLLWRGIFVLLGVLLIFIYGRRQARRLVVQNYEVEIAKEVVGCPVLKLVLISDLHLGYLHGYNQVREIVARIKQLKPDLVCLAGDLFDGNYAALSRPEEIIELFQQVESRYGFYACLGNHDAGNTFPAMLAFYEAAGITLLQEEAVLIADCFVLAGRADLTPLGKQGCQRGSIETVLAQVDLTKPVIILDHQPSRLAENKGVDLLLSGHTHRGQIFPANLITKLLFPVHWGWGREEDLQVIVTSGVGTWGPPLRWGSASEIVQIKIQFVAGKKEESLP